MFSHTSLSSLAESGAPPPQFEWSFLLHTERACALLIGRCLCGMLGGFAPTEAERQTKTWLQSHLFSNGSLSNNFNIGQ